MAAAGSCATVVPHGWSVVRGPLPAALKWRRRRPMHEVVDGGANEPAPFGTTFGGPAGEGEDTNRMRDVLDRETIEKIEELHAAVVRAEAEQRFGLLRGKRTRQVAEAEAAEQAFLNLHGFATYNDFRLRIRRSTVADP